MKPIGFLAADLATNPQTAVMAIDDPSIKPGLMRKFVSASIDSKYQVNYIDYDFQFSSLLQNIPSEEFATLGVGTDLLVDQPIRFDGLDLVTLCTSTGTSLKRKGVVVLDSLNTLQTILAQNTKQGTEGEDQDLVAANHRTAVLLTIVEQFARFYSKSLVVVNLTKLRPRLQGDSTIIWGKELVGGRMTRFKSDVILFASLEGPSDRISRPRLQIVPSRPAADSGDFKAEANDVYYAED